MLMAYIRTMKEFQLQGSPMIQLNQLLKASGIVYSGGEAKMLISDGQVVVNDEVEDRLRRKLKKGDIIKVGTEEIVIRS